MDFEKLLGFIDFRVLALLLCLMLVVAGFQKTKVFDAMGWIGRGIGCIFFAMVLFAAITSSVSIMEAIVASFMDEFHISRKKACGIEAIIAIVFGVVVCLGYNVFFFKLVLPNGSKAQILDVMDYISNNCNYWHK